MMPFLMHARHKLLEGLLLLVAAGYCAVQHIDLSTSAAILIALTAVLYLYDYYLVTIALRITRALFLELVFLVVLIGALSLWQAPFMGLAITLVVGVALLIPLNDHRAELAVLSAWHDVLTKKKETALLLIALVLMLIRSFAIKSIVFLVFFIACLLYRWDSRISATGALLALTACPILLSLELQDSAEQMAVYAYYFLVITVSLQIAETWREKKAI